MKRIALALGIFTCLILIALDCHAARSVGVQIDGVDGQCASFSASTSAGTSVFTCVPVSSQPGAPSGCAATVNSSTSLTLTSAGGSANLAASCSSPASGITWNWSKNSVFGASTSASWTDSLGSNGSTTVDNLYRYQARACNGVACTTMPASPLLVTVRAVGGGGGTFNGTCGGFDSTVVIAMNWGSPTRQYTYQNGGFGANSALVISFTTGNVDTTTSLPRIAAGEYNSPPSSRIATLSSLPCDFGHQSTPGAQGEGNSVTMVFAIGSGSGFGYYPVLTKNTTYYVNIRNSPNSSCVGTGSCEMFVDLVKSGGL